MKKIVKEIFVISFLFTLVSCGTGPNTSSISQQTLSSTSSGLIDPIVSVEPSLVTNFAYDGEFHDAITQGSVTGGKFYYSIDNQTSWTDEIPQIKDVGSYILSYKVVGNVGYNDINAKNLGVLVVSKGNPIIITALL